MSLFYGASASAERCECMLKSCTDQTVRIASKTHGYSRFHRETTNHMMLAACVFCSFFLFRSLCRIKLLLFSYPRCNFGMAYNAYTVISMYTQRRTAREWIELNWMEWNEWQRKRRAEEWAWLGECRRVNRVLLLLRCHCIQHTLACIRFDTEWKQNNLLYTQRERT